MASYTKYAMKKILLLICALVVTVQAQLSLTGTGAHIVDFNTTLAGVNNGAITGGGFQSAPGAGQLDSDAWAVTGWSDGALAFGGIQTTGDYARGNVTAAQTTGGMYAWQFAAGSKGLMFQPGGGDWAPGTLTLRMQNNTGATITQLSISYDLWVRNDQARGNSFNFSYSADNSSYTAVGALDYTSTAAADAMGLTQVGGSSPSRSTTITGLSVANGAYYYIRWTGNDVSGSGSRDEFVLDNISVTPATVAGCSQPATQASALSSTGITDVALTFTGTRGSGSGVLVIARQGSAVTALPTDGTDPATLSPNANFGTAGSSLGSGSRVLYAGNAGSISLNVTGLSCGTIYYFAVLEYSATFCYKAAAATHSIGTTACPFNSNLAINEVYNSGGDEWAEVLVLGTPGATADLRGYVLDDNNGIFSAGATAGNGIASGHLRFANVCDWSAVPVGSVIAIYNETSTSGAPATDDLYDQDADYNYVMAASGGSLFNSNSNAAPDVGNLNYTPYTAATGAWGDISMTDGDAFQVRKPDLSYAMGLSFEPTAGTSDISQADHPDYGGYTTNALYWQYGSGNDITVRMMNASNNDFRNRSNWTLTANTSLTYASGTPGVPNGGNNTTYINSLRTSFPVLTVAASRTCTWRANHTKMWVDEPGGSQFLFCRLKENAGVNRGTTTVTTAVATTGLQTYSGVDYYTFAKYVTVTPTTTTTGSYDITLYLTDAELTAFTSYINTQSGTAYTNSDVKGLIRLIHTFGTTNTPFTAGMASTDFEIVTPATGTYGAAHSFAASGLTRFSGYGFGVEVPSTLPVELTSFEATPGQGQVELQWHTNGEVNNAQFLVERSLNGVDYELLTTRDGAGTTTTQQYYHHTDTRLPIQSGELYYRLKQIDFDGQVQDKGVRVVTLQAPEQWMRVFPNPLREQLYLQPLNADTYGIAVYNHLGQAVYQAGGLYGPQRLATGQWASGLYRVVLTSAHGTEQHNLLKP